jgi:hypothetical protein
MICREEALATDLFSLGLLFLRLLNDDKDPFNTCRQSGADTPDNDAKENMKRSNEFSTEARDMAISLAPFNSTLSMFAEVIRRLLQVSPAARVEGVENIEIEYPGLGFR